MTELNPAQRRELRAQAHHLNPVVSISQKGLQASVLGEIDRCLTAHELIKVRLYGIDREARDSLVSELCDNLACSLVQHIGNLLVLWRPNPDNSEMGVAAATAKRGPRSAKPMTKKQAAANAESPARKAPTMTRRRTRAAP